MLGKTNRKSTEYISGSENGWSWKKFSDGTCEAQGKFTKSGIKLNGTVSGTIVRSDDQHFTLPSFFTTVTSKHVTAAHPGQLMWGGNLDASNIYDLAAYAFLISGSGYSSLDVDFYWCIKGTWK